MARDAMKEVDRAYQERTEREITVVLLKPMDI
jgi:hypothetical protein